VTRGRPSEMAAGDSPGGPTWVVGESIALELDAALTAVGGYFGAGSVEFQALLEAVSPDWVEEWTVFLGQRRRFVSVLELVSHLAGVVAEGDYARATLAMRELDSGAALVALQAPAASGVCRSGSGTDSSAAGARLADIFMMRLGDAYAQVGVPFDKAETLERSIREQVACVAPILKDGYLHSRFWHWLDRFYYEAYLPWRKSRAQEMLEHQRQVVAALGAKEGRGPLPALDWLPRENPLAHYPGLASAVEAAGIRLLFWVEPFGLADSWAVLPGLVAVSTSRPGALFENFRRFAEDVALRARALSDPTRLIILRLVRHMGLVNSTIADYLDLSQPTVSVHAKLLREAGFIRSRKEGRVMRHEVVPGQLERLVRDLDLLLDLPRGPDPARVEEATHDEP
jgi:DNA-binding transcriptional ArsR family regulator